MKDKIPIKCNNPFLHFSGPHIPLDVNYTGAQVYSSSAKASELNRIYGYWKEIFIICVCSTLFYINLGAQLLDLIKTYYRLGMVLTCFCITSGGQGANPLPSWIFFLTELDKRLFLAWYTTVWRDRADIYFSSWQLNKGLHGPFHFRKRFRTCKNRVRGSIPESVWDNLTRKWPLPCREHRERESRERFLVPQWKCLAGTETLQNIPFIPLGAYFLL